MFIIMCRYIREDASLAMRRWFPVTYGDQFKTPQDLLDHLQCLEELEVPERKREHKIVYEPETK